MAMSLICVRSESFAGIGGVSTSVYFGGQAPGFDECCAHDKSPLRNCESGNKILGSE